MAGWLSGIGRTVIVTWVTFASLAVNAGLAWGLVLGEWGLPRMGIAGAALATAIAQMVAAGMTSAQAIVAATGAAAEFIGLNDAGVLEIGRRADFIVLDANPLDDITNTRRISKVYLRGREVDRARLRAEWASQP